MHRSKGAIVTAEEKAARALRARKRFRAAVRLTYENQFWLEDFSNMKLGTNVAKNIRILTQKTKHRSNFTLEHKQIMNTEKDKRTESEKKKLHRVLAGLKCFRRYPSSVKGQLAEVTYFSYIPANRTVVRQDDEAKALFFLLSGQVLVYQRNYDKIFNEWVTTEIGKREPGSMFGEVSLLHGVKRTATIITSDDCELLVVRKEDFEAVLKSSVMAEWDDIKSCMSMFSYFDSWDDIHRRDGCILSKIRFYAKDDILLSEDMGDRKCVYFLIEGECQLVEYVDMEVKVCGCEKTYKLSSKNEKNYDYNTRQFASDSENPLFGQTSSTSTMSMTKRLTLSSFQIKKRRQSSYKEIRTINETHFMRVAIFSRLSTFNIGENFQRRFVVASKNCKVLLIPRYWLIQKNKEIWNHIKHFLNQRLPNTKTVFNDFLQQKKWYSYKKRLVYQILRNCKKVNLNNIHNVPYSIRMQEDMTVLECEETDSSKWDTFMEGY